METLYGLNVMPTRVSQNIILRTDLNFGDLPKENLPKEKCQTFY